jgi:hypothetical protein
MQIPQRALGETHSTSWSTAQSAITLHLARKSAEMTSLTRHHDCQLTSLLQLDCQ